MNKYMGTEKLGRGLPLQGHRQCVDGARRWMEGGFVSVVPGQVVETDLDLDTWVADGYLERVAAPVAVPKPVPKPAPIPVVVPVVVPVAPKPEPVVVPVVAPVVEVPVVKEPEPVVAPVAEPVVEPEPVVEEKPVVVPEKVAETPKPKAKSRFGRGK
jgi:hypothetical protein